jgi:glycerate kinase
MKILLAPDKFKGSLSASTVCRIITRGLHDILPDIEVVQCPISDGGDGFSDVLRSALNGKWIPCTAQDANGQTRETRYALCGSTAIIEMANASGLRHIAHDQIDIWQANTFGTGEMMRHAIEISGAKRIIMGIGGSASNDAGCGMAAALGVRFLDSDGNPLPPTPRALTNVASIDDSKRIPLPEIIVACDVDNPLLGPHGATTTYAPQKGARKNDIPALETLLDKITTLTQGTHEAALPGAGAAGGLGFGLMKFTRAQLMPGFDLVATELKLPQLIADADIVITGEGRLDNQTITHGKGPAGVARLARDAEKYLVAIAGSIQDGAESPFDLALALHQPDIRSLAETIKQSENLLMERAQEIARHLDNT